MLERTLASGRTWARRVRRDVRALWIAARDPRTPWYAKLLAGAVVAYALSPIDLIPDVVPVLGYLDDLVLLPLGILLAVRLIPGPLMAEYRAAAAALDERPASVTGLVVRDRCLALPERLGALVALPRSLQGSSASLSFLTITASISGSSSAATRGAIPRADASASAAPRSQPITAPGTTRSWPPRRRARSQTCQPSKVSGRFSRAGQSGQVWPQAAQ